MRISILVVFSILFFSTAFSQSVSPEMLGPLLENMAKDFKSKMDSEQNEPAEQNATGFIPVKELAQEKIAEASKKILQTISGEKNTGSYSIIEEKQHPVNTVKINVTTQDFPNFYDLGGYIEISSVKDLSGKDMLLDKTSVEKYTNWGIIRPDRLWTRQGMLENEAWLNIEANNVEGLIVKGNIILDVPVQYEGVVLTRSEKGNVLQLDQTSFSLKEIKNNYFILNVKHPERASLDPFKILLLDPVNNIYTSYSRGAVSEKMYEEFKEKKFEISSAEALNMAKLFNETEDSKSDVYITSVPGKLDKVVIYKILKTIQTTIPFEIKI